MHGVGGFSLFVFFVTRKESNVVAALLLNL